MSFRTILATLSAAGLIVLGAVWASGVWRAEPVNRAYAVPGLEVMSAEMVKAQAYRVTPALLSVVYASFAKSQEGAIYDGLAQVAAGDALQALYLERAGTLATGGLDEAKQTIHDMHLTGYETRSAGQDIILDARWEIIGTVGHSTHEHVRGNAYRARFRIAPVEGTWKITGFELLDVDRTDAGTKVAGGPT